MAKGTRRIKRKVSIKKIFTFLIVVTSLSLLFYFVLTFPIQNIYIENNSIVSDDEIIHLASLENYPSFLLTSSKEIQNKILKNSYIESVKIRKKFGNVITIYIKEYSVIAISLNDELILANGEKIQNVYNIYDYPVLINDISDEKIYFNFSKKFGMVDREILRQVSEIEYTPTSVDDERFLLYMNDGNLVYVTLTKIDKLNRYNDIRDKIGDKTGTIYLDAGNYMEIK